MKKAWAELQRRQADEGRDLGFEKANFAAREARIMRRHKNDAQILRIPQRGGA